MKVHNLRVLRGPNIWTGKTVLELWLEPQESLMQSAQELSEFRLRLCRILPQVCQPLTEDDETAQPSELERPAGLCLSLWFARVVLVLQRQAGSPVSFLRIADGHLPRVYKVAVEYLQEAVARRAVELAQELWQAVRDNRPLDLTHPLEELRDLDEQVRLGPSTNSIVQAALKRGIPVRRLNTESLVQLGHGAKQRRIQAAATDRTSALAEDIAQDKQLTKELLAAVGVPVPRGRAVSSADDAWQAALEIGLPIVVKPQDGNQGRGVTTNVHTKEQVLAAYAAARARSDEVMVEQHIQGADYRLLIIDNKLVAAARRDPPQVVGDGRRTIRQLVEEANKDPRRGEHHATSLSKIRLDDIAAATLAEQGLTFDSIPAPGQPVLLRRNANLSTGGTATDVTELVHPEVAARAIDAVRVIGLDIAGVDIVAEDISRPLEAQRGAIIEVNAVPGLRMHLEPSHGIGRPVGEAIVEMLFPAGETGRIPIVAVTGVNGKTTTTRLVAHLLRAWGKRTGLTCTEGIYIDDRLIESGDCSGPGSARAVLAHPLVEAAALETARGGILREGLGFDRCDVAIVTAIGEGDHLGLMGIQTLEQLVRVKRVPVENVSRDGYAVLNAEDPLVAGMAEFCPGQVVYFARDPEHPVLSQQRQRGGRWVCVREGTVVLGQGVQETRLLEVAQIPMTHNGLVGFQVLNALAAAAAAWVVGIPLQVIRQGLRTFTSNMHTAPGRFNVLRYRAATIILDYGHNTSALKALIAAIDQFPAKRRVILYTATGDRRDDDIIAQGKLVADAFDEWVLFQDYSARGRREGEIIALLKRGIGPTARVKKCHEPAGGERAAIEYTLSLIQPGDLLVVQVDQVLDAMDWIRDYLAQRGWTLPESEQQPSHFPAEVKPSH
ncbi:MAG: cyanophycin synthetase [Planctomycetaceae bacterium]|nr:MAG: cyanophycin synthetase [Planctomycetaceae bacterium]